MSYRRKQIIKQVKLFSGNSGELGCIILEKYCRTTLILYKHLKPMKSKYFISCDDNNSYPDNPYRRHKPLHKNGNQIRTSELNTMVFMPEHGNANMEGQIFVTEYIQTAKPDSPDYKIRYSSAVDETCNPPRTPRQILTDNFPPADGICDRGDTYSNMEPVAKLSSEQSNATPTNPRSTKYNLRHNLQPTCNDDYR